MKNGDKTFIKVTNRDIFEKIDKMEKSMTAFHEKMEKKTDLLQWAVGVLGAGGAALYALVIAHLFGI